jgi:hypothetical protein
MFNGDTASKRIAEELFDNDFLSCIDKEISEIEEDFKTYSALTVAQGQIRLHPGTKRQIKSFVQWVKDKVRTGQDPSITIFPIVDTVALIRRHKSHLAFCEKSKRLSETAKPQMFTESIKWTDWIPVFTNFLKSLPGRHGVPLTYVIRDNDDAMVIPSADMFDDYMNRAPLTGEALNADASEVHTYIVNFIAGNETAESKILAFADQSNGRLDFKALQDHYEGVGINSIAIKEADDVIENLQYTGERQPTMWWNEFERKLTTSFNIYDKKERRQVYSDEMKVSILCRKINADFLEATRQFNQCGPHAHTSYHDIRASYEVNRKSPPSLTTNERTRRMGEVDTAFNRGRGGRSGRGGRFGGRGRRQGRQDGNSTSGRTITGVDGRSMEVHPSYNFSEEDWRNILYEEKGRLVQERRDYNSNKRARVGEVQRSKKGDESRNT